MAGATHAETSFWHKPAGAVRSCCKFRNLLSPQHISGFFCCRPLCIAQVQLQCKVIGDWPLRAARGNGICTTHICSKRLLVGEKAKPLIFARKKESCFPKVEHTWNWNVRRTKAALTLFRAGGAHCAPPPPPPGKLSKISQERLEVKSWNFLTYQMN